MKGLDMNSVLNYVFQSNKVDNTVSFKLNYRLEKVPRKNMTCLILPPVPSVWFALSGLL